MTLQLRKAERKKAKLRIGVFGPSGAGKTMSALKMASGMVPWEKIVIIDTENKSADLYSHLGPYNVLTLEAPFSPEKYIEAISAAEKAEMEVIIIDSITHEWAGAGGILEMADSLSKDSKSSFMVWSKLTPRHNKFVDRIVSSKVHVICCGRSKQDYAINQTEKHGKIVNVPEKIGLKAVTREGFDYEMTISFDLMISHYAISTKDRTSLFQDKAEEIISEATGKKLMDWANSGREDLSSKTISEEQRNRIFEIITKLKANPADVENWVKKVKKVGILYLNQEQADEIINLLQQKYEANQASEKSTATALKEFEEKVEGKNPEVVERSTEDAEKEIDVALGLNKKSESVAVEPPSERLKRMKEAAAEATGKDPNAY